METNAFLMPVASFRETPELMNHSPVVDKCSKVTVLTAKPDISQAQIHKTTMLELPALLETAVETASLPKMDHANNAKLANSQISTSKDASHSSAQEETSWEDQTLSKVDVVVKPAQYTLFQTTREPNVSLFNALRIASLIKTEFANDVTDTQDTFNLQVEIIASLRIAQDLTSILIAMLNVLLAHDINVSMAIRLDVINHNVVSDKLSKKIAECKIAQHTPELSKDLTANNVQDKSAMVDNTSNPMVNATHAKTTPSQTQETKEETDVLHQSANHMKSSPESVVAKHAKKDTTQIKEQDNAFQSAAVDTKDQWQSTVFQHVKTALPEPITDTTFQDVPPMTVLITTENSLLTKVHVTYVETTELWTVIELNVMKQSVLIIKS